MSIKKAEAISAIKGELTVDSALLTKLGFNPEIVHIIEYDLPSEQKIYKEMDETEKSNIKKRNDLARYFRNKVIFQLTYKLKAFRVLESHWIASEMGLEYTKAAFEEIKAEMKERGFSDADKRLKIYPIMTVGEILESYEERKLNFVFELLKEHQKQLDKAEKDGIARGSFWRCKQIYSQIAALSEELKTNGRYSELIDVLGIYHDTLGKVETMLEKEKEA